MKLGEGGEAFFVFETSNEIPESLQTSPVISPVTSPQALLQDTASTSTLQEPDFLDLTANEGGSQSSRSNQQLRPVIAGNRRAQSDFGMLKTRLLALSLH